MAAHPESSAQSDTPLSLVRAATQQTITWQLDRTVETASGPVMLDAAQQHVADHRHGAMLVLAGPGTGKTATLTEAVIARLSDESDPLRADQVLVLTFARKAATEIRDRIVSRLNTASVPAVSTFHSLALSIVREFRAENLGEPTLLSGPEQELVVREILMGLVEDARVRSTVQWPEDLNEALEKRGLTVEIRNALARARSLGISGDELQAIARASNKPEWFAAGQLLVQYLDSIENTTSLDYNELIFEAVRITGEEFAQQTLRSRFRAVFVDEYQDTDPLQVELLRNLVGPQASLIAVGDPDQSIYGFRGADSRAIKNFSEAFSYVGSKKPEIAVLDSTRRFGETIREAVYRVIDRNSLTELPEEAARAHRSLKTDPTKTGTVEVAHYESAEVEAEEVAERIRALVLSPGSTTSWSDVAVLVRSGSSSIATLERAFLQAQVPVSVIFDEMPISQEPAVALLLHALEVSLKPHLLKNAETATNLLMSPLANLQPSDVRRIGRALRQHARLLGEQVQWSEELIAEALANPASFVDFDPRPLGDAWTRLVALRNLLADAHVKIEQGKSVHEVLWFLWSSTEWPQRLRRIAIAQGAGSARAHHDLDAVISLFDLAQANTQNAKNRRSVNTFLAHVRGLLVPAAQTQRHVTSDAVSLMTAHRSKGLQWKAVFVCSVDEGSWPDVRRRSSIFEPERLAIVEGQPVIGELPERSDVVSEERRLFFVACTRAQQHLEVSSTSLNPESGRVPSRFFKQLRPDVPMPGNDAADPEHEAVLPELLDESTPRYSVSALVGQLRRVASNPLEADTRRAAAATRLAYLAELKDQNGTSLVPSAHPLSWWGLAEVTDNATPITELEAPVYVRGSSAQTLFDCSLAWFMSQRAKADEVSNIAMVFGSVVHAIADAVNRGEILPTTEQMSEVLDAAWAHVPSDSEWTSAKDKKEALNCLEAFVQWRNDRVIIGSEVDFAGEWTVRGPEGQSDTVVLRGQIDIIALEAGDALYIADLKTTSKSSAPSQKKTEVNLQLGLYQAAVERQLIKSSSIPAVDPHIEVVAGGAELVLLRSRLAGGKPSTRTQPPVNLREAEPSWIETKMFEAADIVRSERFVPTLGDACKFCPIKNACPLKDNGKPVIS
jgi:superfamily I DNA/RNA helicase/RecB family exonuclease